MSEVVRRRRFIGTVVVECETREQAEQVFGERIGHDEDYGFPYWIDSQDLMETTEVWT